LQVRELQQQLECLQAKYESSQQQNSRMQQQLSQIRHAYASLLDKHMQLQQRLTAAEQQLSASRQRVSKLSQQVQDLRQGLQVIHTQLGPNWRPAFKNMVHRDRNRRRARNAAVTKRQHKLKQLNQQIKKVERSVPALFEQVRDLLNRSCSVLSLIGLCPSAAAAAAAATTAAGLTFCRSLVQYPFSTHHYADECF
jgi:uncharacterized protein YoxC